MCRQFFRRFIFDETAATAAEYAVMLALILMGVIAAITSFGTSTGGLWGGINSDLESTAFGGS